MTGQIIDIEHKNRAGETLFERGVEYAGVGGRRREADKVLWFRRTPGGRRSSIYVDFIEAVRVNGEWKRPELPHDRQLLRSHEIHKLIEGRFAEGWAAEYFTPASPKYFKAVDPDDNDLDAFVDEAFAQLRRRGELPPPHRPVFTGPDGHCPILAAQPREPIDINNLTPAQRFAYGALGFTACAVGALTFLGVVMAIFA